jgi:hypothetical protein
MQILCLRNKADWQIKYWINLFTHYAMELNKVIYLKRCPHCNIADPLIEQRSAFETSNINGDLVRTWVLYVCRTCGGVITASRYSTYNNHLQMFPEPIKVDECLPEKAKYFLNQAIETMHAPAASIMSCASSIDAMLKDKGYKDDSLFKRIDKAALDHLITNEMAEWAHVIRLEANDQRHADESASLPTNADAKRIVEYALALAEFLYVLPSRIKKGIDESKHKIS